MGGTENSNDGECLSIRLSRRHVVGVRIKKKCRIKARGGDKRRGWRRFTNTVANKLPSKTKARKLTNSTTQSLTLKWHTFPTPPPQSPYALESWWKMLRNGRCFRN